MSENLGVIEYQVRADVSDLISSAGTLENILSGVEKRFADLDATVIASGAAARKTALGINGLSAEIDAMSTEAGFGVNAITQMIERMKEEARVAGLTTQQKQLYIAATKGASFAQLEQIKTLQQYTAQAERAAATSGRMRGAMQGLGYQIQDVAVSLQGGMNPFVVLSQQGSQIASLFGPSGAVVGALLAVGGAAAMTLAPSLMKSKDSSEELEEAMKALGEVMTTSEDGVDSLSRKILKLAESSEKLAKAEIARGMSQAKIAIASAAGAIDDATSKYDDFAGLVTSSKAASQLEYLDRITAKFGVTSQEVFDGNVPAFYLNKISELKDFAARLESQFGLTADQSIRFIQSLNQLQNNKTTANMQNLADVVASIGEQNGFTSDKFNELSQTIIDNSQKAGSAQEAINYLSKAMADLGLVAGQSEAVLSGSARAIAQMVAQADAASFSIGKTAGQIAAHAAETAGADIATQEYIKTQYDAVDAAEAQKKAEQQAATDAKRRASEAEQNAKRIQSANQSNIDKIEESKIKTQQLAEQYSNLKVAEDGTIDSTMRHTAESAKLAAQQQLNKQATEAQVNALAKEILAQDQLKQKYEEQKKAAEERNRLTAEFNPVQQAGTDYAKQQKDLESARALNLITEQQYQQQKEILARTYEQNRMAAAEELYKQQSAGNEFLMNSLDALGNAATSTISGLLSGTMSVTEAMQNFANIILNQAVGALVEMGLNYVKQQLLSQAMAAANIATASATGTAIAAAYAPAAAMASLASFGGNAAPASAGIASTTALASSLALAGGRRYGGPVNPGSMYPVNEGGAPEMLTVGAKQYLMPNARGEVISNSDATGGSGGVTFIVNNNASNVVSTTQSYDESTKTVTLAVNEVARQLATRTGPVSKGLQGGYNVSGRTA